ncbi:MAG TPA: oxidoreductase [Ruminococcaceae bacterium]|nr:oxidoreductase [Oscillospiraceae bacterium]
MDRQLQLTYGMIGGGPGAFIGDPHRRSIALDGEAKLVAGCFSNDGEKTAIMAEVLDIEIDRCYAGYKYMAKAESEREDGIDFVVVVTPNSTHYEICKTFLEYGINVVCDKPLAVTYEQAAELCRIAKEKNLLFMVTYTYMGYVTSKFARDVIKNGEIGDVRMVMAEYPQGWLAFENDNGGKQGIWRCNPSTSGGVNCLGDLGTHVENAVATFTGLKIKRVLAKMDKVVPGRVLDDNDCVMVEFDNGATGMFWSSQIAIGYDNDLRVRVYGSNGTLEWFQRTPDIIKIIDSNNTVREIHRGHSTVTDTASKYNRLPAGHPEGWMCAMSNLYRSYIECVLAKKRGTFTEDMIDFPTAEQGADGLAFVEACLESNEKGNTWVEIKK